MAKKHFYHFICESMNDLYHFSHGNIVLLLNRCQRQYLWIWNWRIECCISFAFLSLVLSLKKWFVDMTLIRYNVEIKCLVTCSKYAELLGISQIRWLWSRDTLKMSFIEKSIVHKHRIIADQRNLWIQFWVNRFSYSLLISFDFLCSLVLFPLKNCLLHFANLSTPSLIWTLVRLSCNSQVNFVFINVTFAIAFINDFCSDFAYDYDSFKCKCSLGTHFTDRLCYISVVWLKWWRDNKKKQTFYTNNNNNCIKESTIDVDHKREIQFTSVHFCWIRTFFLRANCFSWVASVFSCDHFLRECRIIYIIAIFVVAVIFTSLSLSLYYTRKKRWWRTTDGMWFKW